MRLPNSSRSATGLFSFSISFRNLLMFLTMRSFLVSSPWLGKWFRILYEKLALLTITFIYKYLLSFVHPHTWIRMEYSSYGFWKCPENVPLLILLTFLPTALLKILYQSFFIQISLKPKFLNLLRLREWLHFLLSYNNNLNEL